ncbi:HalOD1 output domain-containing protein [Natronorubrum sp. FCH18a]|uniref:HalOD1 output domain-containing protein n=1 Tax=Natronorubrum sp. FCH18a TaxID=3447018 RepID=UPI003F5166C1
MNQDQLSLQCDCTPVGVHHYDSDSDTSPAVAVIRAIAVVTDTKPGDLAPLYETIDTEALNELFEHHSNAPHSGEQVLAFTADGWNVFVRDDGQIRVCDPTGPDTPSPIFE